MYKERNGQLLHASSCHRFLQVCIIHTDSEAFKAVREIFKKYGMTVASVFLAAGVTIGAVIGAITNALKAMGKQIAGGLKNLGAKAASALPGLIGSIVGFLFRTAGQAIGFLAEHTWLLILAVVAFFFQKLTGRYKK